MSRIRGILVAAVMVSAWLAAVGGTASAEETSDKDDSPRRDYLRSGVTVQAAGQDQCSKPVEDREGAWVCDPEGGTVSPMDAGIQCNLAGACWQFKESTFYRANNWVAGAFGYGNEPLGTARMYSSNHLNGAQMRTRTQLKIDTNTRDLVAEGDLLYGPQDSRGGPINGQYEFRVDSGQAPNNTWFPWGSGGRAGYKSYDQRRGNHANVIQYTWGKGGYPGTWWMYMKSVIAADHDNNGIYRFLDPGYRFWYSHEGGYHG